MAFAVFQLPSCEIDPQINTFSPYVVVSSSLKVTATDVTVGHGVEVGEVLVDVVVGAGPPLALVCPGGNIVFVAVTYGPLAEVAEHAGGTLFAEDSPHAAGT